MKSKRLNLCLIFLLMGISYLFAADDITLVGNIDDDDNDEVIFFNRAGNSGVVRAIDALTGLDEKWYNWEADEMDFIDPTDQAFLGDINHDKHKELIIVNSSSYSGNVFLIFDFFNNERFVLDPNEDFDSFFDPGDKIFINDVNDDGDDEMVLLNMSGSGKFLKVINLTTGLAIKTITYLQINTSLNGWIDPDDRIFIGKINNNSLSDILFINSAYNSGAIRAIEIMTNDSFKWIDHGPFSNLMDADDRIFLGDINNDQRDDLVFVDSDNTRYTETEKNTDIKTFDIMSSSFLMSMYNTGFGSITGWNDACDRQDLLDVNGDGKKDLVMINIAKDANAIRVIDLETGYNLKFISRDDLVSNDYINNNWFDSGDKLLFGAINSSKNALYMINTSGSYGLIRVLDIMTNNTIHLTNYYELSISMNGWLNGIDNNSLTCTPGINTGMNYDQIHVCGGLFIREEKPANFKLYTRNENNIGHIKVAGYYKDPEGASSINFILIKRIYDFHVNPVKITSESSEIRIDFDSGGHFTADIEISAGFFEYDLYYYVTKEEDAILIASNIVCGDAYIISGQSNAVTVVSDADAAIIDAFYGSNNSYGRFSRTFAWYHLNGDRWNISRTKSTIPDPYGVGVWGLKLQYELQKKNEVPTLLINNGVPGTGIYEHISNPKNPFYFDLDNEENLNGMLFSRCFFAGAEKNIKAIYWYNGEDEVTYSPFDPDRYPDYFYKLQQDIQKMIPCQNIYQIQIASGSRIFANEMRIVSEKQRELPPHYTSVKLMASNGCEKNPLDPIHLSRIGYEELGRRIYNITEEYVYNKSVVSNPNPINVIKSWFEGNTVIIEFDQRIDVINSDPPSNIRQALTFYDNTIQIKDVVIQDHYLIITLVDPSAISRIKEVGYCGFVPSENFPCFLYNSDNVAALSFDRLPVLSKNLSFTYNPTNEVEKDHLFEISFSDSLIQGLTQHINNFLGDLTGQYKPNPDPSSNYAQSFKNGIIVNPYDPEHISLEAYFFKPGSTIPIVRYGFYYRKYLPMYNNDKSYFEEVANVDHWKVRFSPDEVGTWKFYLYLKIGDKPIGMSPLYSILVKPTDDPGYVRTNGRFWKFSNTQDQFLPIGHNIPWTNWYESKPSNIDDLLAGLDLISCQDNNGANATRLMVGKNHYEFEWEKLNNYDTRQTDMFSLDMYFEHLDLLDMYGTLAILCQDEFQTFPHDAKDVDWRSNPYNQFALENGDYKGIDGIVSPKDFYTNENARKFYQKKLRYINARYGYTTHLMIYELQSEMSNTELFLNTDESFPPENFKNAIRINRNWFDEMAGYMKNDLGCKQLTSISFGMERRLWRKEADYLLESPLMDAILPHFYDTRENIISTINTSINDINGNRGSDIKPIMIQECGHMSYMDQFDICSDLTYHKFMWGSTFAGSTGILYWPFSYLLRQNPENQLLPLDGINSLVNNIGSKIYESEYFTNLPGVQRFFNNKNINLNQAFSYYHTYEPSADLLPFFENVYMVSADRSITAGWIVNRSSNIFNCDDCINNFYMKKNHQSFSENVSDIWQYSCENDDSFWYGKWPATFGNSMNCTSDIMPPIETNTGEENYNKAFFEVYPTSTDLVNKYVGNKMQGLENKTFQMGGFDTQKCYTISWFSTWNDPTNNMIAGELHHSQEITPSSEGILTINIPTTIEDSHGNKFPGDWAYIIKASTCIKSITIVDSISQHRDPYIVTNPCHENTILKCDETNLPYSISIYNSQGKLMSMESFISSTEKLIDVSKYQPGIYYLKFKSNNLEKTLKLLKQ